MQWNQAGKLSLIALIIGIVPGCMRGASSQNFGVPYPPAWQARMAQPVDPGDKIQSPAVTPQDSTALAMTAYDEVQLGAGRQSLSGKQNQLTQGFGSRIPVYLCQAMSRLPGWILAGLCWRAWPPGPLDRGQSYWPYRKGWRGTCHSEHLGRPRFVCAA